MIGGKKIIFPFMMTGTYFELLNSSLVRVLQVKDLYRLKFEGKKNNKIPKLFRKLVFVNQILYLSLEYRNYNITVPSIAHEMIKRNKINSNFCIWYLGGFPLIALIREVGEG